MPLLRKTGARSPWMPAPLLPFTVEQVRRAIVVAALIPPMLFGGNAQWVGARPRLTPTDMAPATRVVPQQPPIIAAIVQRVGAVVLAPDRFAPITLVGTTAPLPGSVTLAMTRPRDEVVAQPDRLSPPLVSITPLRQVDALALWLGMLRRGAAGRPGQRPLMFSPAPPAPWANAQWIRAGLDPTVPNPIIGACALLTQRTKPLALLAQTAKPRAMIARALPIAVLSRQTKPIAVLMQQTKPSAAITQRAC